MSSLADLPELVGFFSYSREDDADSQGALSTLRTRIQGELRGLLGRNARTFRLWQDKEAIPSGTLWENEIKTAVAQSVFFVPIITPTVVASRFCQFELDSFLAREAELGRDDLVFPILYIDVPALEDAAQRDNEPVLSLIARRQYMDWRKLRHREVRTTEVSEAIERFCVHIRNSLHRPWVSPEQRGQLEAKAARAPAEAERAHQEAQAKRCADEESSWRVVEAERRRLDAEAEQRRIAAVAVKAQAEAREQPPSGETTSHIGRDMQKKLAEWQRQNQPTMLGLVVRRLFAVAIAFSAVMTGWALLMSTPIQYGAWLVPMGLLWLAGYLWKGWG